MQIQAVNHFCINQACGIFLRIQACGIFLSNLIPSIHLTNIHCAPPKCHVLCQVLELLRSPVLQTIREDSYLQKPRITVGCDRGSSSRELRGL